MICYFQSGRQPARPANDPALPPAVAADPAQVLLALLDQLRGRQVTLLVCGRGEVSGRLITTAPITLVSADGRNTVVTGSICSVGF